METHRVHTNITLYRTSAANPHEREVSLKLRHMSTRAQELQLQPQPVPSDITYRPEWLFWWHGDPLADRIRGEYKGHTKLSIPSVCLNTGSLFDA
ncbi:unnamed protein product [[Candida] boidinii]|uniref:Unnamed protein product n=1 Tax=Candida boidinii TaxID=5477 RepID=A0ACB5TLL8_CANBO|nr:unnamed protein product [[Candida] boidinii]